MIHGPKSQAWITRHNTQSMIRSLFMGKVWDYDGKKLVIRQIEDGKWIIGCLVVKEDTKEETVVPINMDLNYFMALMSNENILFETVLKK